MTTIAMIVSGAGLPDWLWDDVRARLKMPTRIAPKPADSDATVTEYARAALVAAHSGRILLVAHSAGGVVASEIAALAAPGQIAGIVGVTAVIPPSGGSFTSAMPFPQNVMLPVVLRVAGTRPPESAIRNALASGIDPTAADRLVADFTPEPRQYFTSRVRDTEPLRALPTRSYLLTTDDAEFPIGQQERFAARMRPHTLIRVQSGHLPMLTHPDDVAGAITSAALTDQAARD
ncbi:alpha/beta hydrolase [Agromyces sp. NPDC058110]|uniref:alpha/beta hydrolase n=1 Tax=Agromyces sp. NPDC058110 TaxID=3346345 RepID=UPI0036DF6859